ncbi:MAG: hypothetical protein AAFQ40_11460, partial [Cyanobacteria bacterium J06623_5]
MDLPGATESNLKSIVLPAQPLNDTARRRANCGVSNSSDTIVSHPLVSTPLRDQADSVKASIKQSCSQKAPHTAGNWKFFGASVNQDAKV